MLKDGQKNGKQKSTSRCSSLRGPLGCSHPKSPALTKRLQKRYSAFIRRLESFIIPGKDKSIGGKLPGQSRLRTLPRHPSAGAPGRRTAGSYLRQQNPPLHHSASPPLGITAAAPETAASGRADTSEAAPGAPGEAAAAPHRPRAALRLPQHGGPAALHLEDDDARGFNSPFCNAAAVMRFITFYAYRRARKTTARRAGMRLTKPGGGLGAPRRASPSASRPGRGGRRREGSAAPGHGALGGGTRPEPAGLTAPQCRRLRRARPFGGERGGTAGGEKLE